MSLYHEIKITDKCTFSEDNNKTCKKWSKYRHCPNWNIWLYGTCQMWMLIKGTLLYNVTYTFPGFTGKFSHTWYKHRFGCERATVSTSCIWPRADTVTRRDENDGMNLSRRGSNITWMGVTARITRRSYTMRKRSTDKLPCLNNRNMYQFIIHKHFIT
jgi:hypothetical protein